MSKSYRCGEPGCGSGQVYFIGELRGRQCMACGSYSVVVMSGREEVDTHG